MISLKKYIDAIMIWNWTDPGQRVSVQAGNAMALFFGHASRALVQMAGRLKNPECRFLPITHFNGID
jgi:hypothetical protein